MIEPVMSFNDELKDKNIIKEAGKYRDNLIMPPRIHVVSDGKIGIITISKEIIDSLARNRYFIDEQ